VEDAYPAGNKTKMMRLLERCTKALSAAPQYANDIRYVRRAFFQTFRPAPDRPLS
jgi:hypothetical protein